MTYLIDKALAEIKKLPEACQDAIAAIILEELEDEVRWDKAFAGSQGKLETLADRVRQDICGGKAERGKGV